MPCGLRLLLLRLLLCLALSSFFGSGLFSLFPLLRLLELLGLCLLLLLFLLCLALGRFLCASLLGFLLLLCLLQLLGLGLLLLLLLFCLPLGLRQHARAMSKHLLHLHACARTYKPSDNLKTSRATARLPGSSCMNSHAAWPPPPSSSPPPPPCA